MKCKMFFLVAIFSLSLQTYAQNIEDIKEELTHYNSVDTISININSDSLKYIIKNVHGIFEDMYYGFGLVSTIEVFAYNSNKLVQKFIDTSGYYQFGGGIDFEDVNLDGYKDIVIDCGAARLTSVQTIWLYDETNSLFIYNENFSELGNYYVDEDTKTIISDDPYGGGRGGITTHYKIDNNDLVLAERNLYSNEWEYARFRNELYSNGILNTVISGESSELLPQNLTKTRNDTAFVEIYNLFFDSLLVETKLWMSYYSEFGSWRDESLFNFLTEWGCYKYFKKEKYSYSKMNGDILVETTKYKLINNDWIKIK